MRRWNEPHRAQFTLNLPVLLCEMICVGGSGTLSEQTSLKSFARLKSKSSGPEIENALEILWMSRVMEMGPRLATEQTIPVDL